MITYVAEIVIKLNVVCQIFIADKQNEVYTNSILCSYKNFDFTHYSVIKYLVISQFCQEDYLGLRRVTGILDLAS